MKKLIGIMFAVILSVVLVGGAVQANTVIDFRGGADEVGYVSTEPPRVFRSLR